METKEKSQNLSILLAVVTMVVTVAVVALIGYLFVNEQEDVVQGQVDVSEYRVSSKVPGRVLSLRVHEGDRVQVGDTLALLEVPEVSAQEASAQAAVSAATALSQMANNGARQEQIEGAKELWNQAKVGLDLAKKSLDRVQRLYDEGVVTAQKLDEATANYQAFEAKVAAAKSQYDMAVNGAREEERRAAAEKVKMAEGNVALVNASKKETVQIATHDGEVSEVYPKEGELVGQGSPIMTIAMTDDIWGTFNVREDQLQGMKVGSTIKVYVPAFDKEISMKVYFMKDQGTYAVWKATKANGQYDLKTFEVRARQEGETLEGLRPGMSLILR